MAKTGTPTCTICRNPIANAVRVSKRHALPFTGWMVALVLLSVVLVSISVALLVDADSRNTHTKREILLSCVSMFCIVALSGLVVPVVVFLMRPHWLFRTESEFRIAV